MVFDPASLLVGTLPSEMKTPEGRDEGTGCLLTRLVVKETWKQHEHQQGRAGKPGESHVPLWNIYLPFTNQVSV